MYGTFDDGIFAPSNTLLFYIVWILLPSIYYGSITFISIRLYKLTKKHKPQQRI
jgi:hypothetical protein